MAEQLLRLHGDNAKHLVAEWIVQAIDADNEYGFNFWTGVFDVITIWQRQGGYQTRH